MRSKHISRLGSFVLAALFVFSQLSIFAAGDSKVKITFTDVTSSANTLTGEAKVMVSVEGADGSARIAQMAFGFEGALKYKSTQFLKGENNPENGLFWIEKKTSDKALMTSIIATNGLSFGEKEDLFIITFSGNPGDTVTLKLTDLENTYITVDGEDRYPESEEEITLTASEKENEGVEAVVSLEMDKVLDFTGTGDSGITVRITNDKNAGDTISTTVDTSSESNGGHRDGTSTTPTFIIKNILSY